MRLANIIKISVLTLGLLAGPAPAMAQGDADGDSGETSPADAKQDKKDKKAQKKAKRRSRRVAKKKFQQGLKLAREGSYEEAAAAFLAAYEADPRPEVLYNVAQMYRQNDETVKAYETYGKYLELAPKGKLARRAKRYRSQMKTKVDAENARLERENKLADQAAQNRQKAEDERRKAQEAEKQSQEALRAAQAELEKTREQEAATAADRDRMADLVANPRGGTKRIIGTSMAAVGGLALGIGILAGLDARSAHNELDGLGPDDRWAQSYDWVHDHGQSSQTKMIAFTVTGALLLAGGGVMYFLGDREARETRGKGKAVSVTPSVNQRGAGVQVLGRF